MEKTNFDEINFNELSPTEIGEVSAEITDLINRTQDLIDECNEVLGGEADE